LDEGELQRSRQSIRLVEGFGKRAYLDEGEVQRSSQSYFLRIAGAN
jgi:hypothetical protein